jgi:hypothetical protein
MENPENLKTIPESLVASVNCSCLSCKFFKSFSDDYFDDIEPDDQGFCLNSESKYFGNEGAGCDIVCEFHNQIDNSGFEKRMVTQNEYVEPLISIKEKHFEKSKSKYHK